MAASTKMAASAVGFGARVKPGSARLGRRDVSGIVVKPGSARLWATDPLDPSLPALGGSAPGPSG